MGLKPHGKQLPAVANPEKEICFMVTMPDTPEYRAAILGQVSFLSFWFAWEHVNDGVIPDDNKEAARLWAQAMGTFKFEECMDICEQVATCFAEDAEFRASVINSMRDDPLFRSTIQEISKVGQPLGPEIIVAPIVEECDYDRAWGGLQAMIEVIDRTNEDFLQFIEAYSNEIEKGAALIANIPLFGELVSSLTLQFVNTFVEDATENYVGVVTIELLEEYACGLFCLLSDDPSCSLTFEQIYNYFRDRVLGEFDINTAFGTVVEFIASGTYTGTAIVDFMFMMSIQTVRSADSFLGFDYATLQAAIDMGKEDGSSSWETICTDCPPPPPEGCIDFTVSDYDWSAYTYGSYSAGNGFAGQYLSLYNQTILFVARTAISGAPDVDEYVFNLSTSVDAQSAKLFLGDVFQGEIIVNPTSSIVFNEASIGGTWPKNANLAIRLELTTGGNVPFYLIEECTIEA